MSVLWSKNSNYMEKIAPITKLATRKRGIKVKFNEIIGIEDQHFQDVFFSDILIS